MLWLGLALSSLYAPGITGATVQTSWAVLSLSLPALALWSTVRLTVFHWAFFLWAAIVTISIAWSLNRWDAVWGWWQVILFVLAFYYASSKFTLERLFVGFGIGANLSALVAIAQAYGYHPVMVNEQNIAGLYYNSMYAGEIFAVTILGLGLYHRWRLIPLPLVALFLSHSHAGWIGLGIGLVVSRFRYPLLLAIGAALAAAIFTYHFRPSDAERLQVWYAALTNLTLFGHGPGSFLSLWYPRDASTLIFPEYAHNDALQLVFEYGALALIPLGALLALAIRSTSREWPIYIAILFMGLVSFPLYTPILAFFGASVAGVLAGDWDLRWNLRPGRGLDLLLGRAAPLTADGHHRRDALPLVSRA